ncbi:non-hydrolyzing UDP-N-acetylglucosamine 2-epimerase [Sphingopyxis terrae]|uniref:UDP-N-acetylglucosamine 2-epimerase (non-hydrolyzing) n=1 Tax=Sphingopyxis terrae subsp. ummariensis TaxID=429001 RepID=A0A1Y6FTX2_9SPHN|nr:UDP-N-acetylglucosamine 2-epimerase (non-hydrolyzing) [Sphingopyxis terrae]PCF91411.1 UDP-N-acetylglucosamine 2-epimerase (non-hydrolyzing) [Sphingopyxis terrae subsp. ummariensis]SMQ76600.1 UDP-N-Acetylglucosamine 2-epimerase [Sphingopyxis terrae subsp. ummariensis]
MKIATVFGTRPEAIKMFPVIHALQRTEGVDVRVCVTAQHREMLDQVLEIARIAPDVDLDVMTPNQSLDALLVRLVTGLGETFDTERPDRILVHGDTLTTMAATLAAYFRKIPVGHVEAGLRSGDIYHPWPEEVNRKVTGSVADLHFAPTETAAAALRSENVPDERIHVTGNTVIDALLATKARIDEDPSLAAGLDPLVRRYAGKRIIAVTSHRRENFGDGMRAIAEAIAGIAARPDVAVIFPVHPNPHVRGAMEPILGDLANVALIDPLDYPHFVRLIGASSMILTDSGGVQEEAPSLGKPVIVMRETTERPEGIEAGTARLVGTDKHRIVSEIFSLLDNEAAYNAMARAHNPFGDGLAAQRIAEIVARAN